MTNGRQLVTEVSEDFLTWLAVERGRAINTLKAYERDLKRYHAHLVSRKRTPIDADDNDVIAFVLDLQVSGFSSVLSGTHVS